MQIKVHASIDDIPADQWDSVASDTLVCRHAFIRAVERAGVNDCRFFYPVIYEDQRPVAHAAAYQISTELDLFAKGWSKKVIDVVRRRYPRFLILRSVECGSPVALGSSISVHAASQPERARDLLVSAVGDIARRQNVRTVLVRDFYSEQLPQFDALLEHGYRRIPNLSCARMRIRWRTHEAYLADMRSQYRSKMLAQVRRFETSGGHLTVAEKFSERSVELARLWQNVYDRATEYRREILTPAFFESMDIELGLNSFVILAERAGVLIGFLLVLVHRGEMFPLFCGLDYSCSMETGVYFNMFYEATRIAIARGFEEIDFGITTLLPKLDLGASAVPLFMYMRIANVFLNPIVPRAFELMTPKCPVTSRRVFRNAG